MTPSAGIEPGSDWWKARALTTAPTLLPHFPFKRKGTWPHSTHINPSLGLVLLIGGIYVNGYDIFTWKLASQAKVGYTDVLALLSHRFLFHNKISSLPDGVFAHNIALATL